MGWSQDARDTVTSGRSLRLALPESLFPPLPWRFESFLIRCDASFSGKAWVWQLSRVPLKREELERFRFYASSLEDRIFCEPPPQRKRLRPQESQPEAVGVETLAGCPGPAAGALPAGAGAAPATALPSPAGRGHGRLSRASGAVFLWLLPKRPGPSASLPDPARPRRLHRLEEPLSSSRDRPWSPALWTWNRQRHSSTRRGPKPWAVGALLSPLTGSFSASPPLLSLHIPGLPGRFWVAQS